MGPIFLSNDTSVERYSFIATCELHAGGEMYQVAQAGPEFLLLQLEANVPAGPAQLVIQYDDQPGPIRRQIEVVGPTGMARRLSIRR